MERSGMVQVQRLVSVCCFIAIVHSLHGADSECDRPATKRKSLPPSMGDECTTECAKPYTCALGPFRHGSRAGQTGRFCQCLPPYIRDGRNCYLECKLDEYYEDFTCKKRCSPGHFRLEDGTCVKMSLLGQVCKSRKQCAASFSDCVNGKCECAASFVPDEMNKQCVSRVFVCPFGKPLRRSGAVFQCGFANSSHSSTSNCPDGYVCVLTAPTSPWLGIGPGSLGHCCPTPKSTCPVGEPHPTAVCNADGAECPEDTHYCRSAPYSWSLQEPICCLRACAPGQVFVRGSCYPIGGHGDQCEHDEQCGRYTNLKCQKGRCLCESGYVVNKCSNSSGSYQLNCVRQCQEGEMYIPWNDQCKVLTKLDQGCDPNEENVCGKDAFCSTQSKTCICECYKIQLTAYHCGARPRCGESPVNGSITLCKTAETKARNDSIVGTCLSDQYCAGIGERRYGVSNEFGVCCPKPDRMLCPNGSHGTKKCNPNIRDSCGENAFCWRYLDIAASSDPAEGHVCCE